MRYKLYENSRNDIENPIQTVFENRGLSDKNYFKNIHKRELCELNFNLLDNMQEAKELFLMHMVMKNKIGLLVDCDVDGFTSASILYRYIKKFDKDIEIEYFIHSGKQHGLSDEIKISDDIKLLIISDAGTNDVLQCKELKERGIDILILDHHISDFENPYAIIVNNRLSKNYPNKDLCGVGVVYKFLQMIDEFTMNRYSEDMIDMVALGLIADDSDVRVLENRYLINSGMSNIKSKFFKALIEKQAYSLGESYTSFNLQFYVVPLINAMIRAGTENQKVLMFQAFIQYDENGSEFCPEFYAECARVCSAVKSKQDRAADKAFYSIIDIIKNSGLDKNQLIFCDVTSILDSTLTGLTAMKIAEYFKKPTLLLRKYVKPLALHGVKKTKTIPYRKTILLYHIKKATSVLQAKGKLRIKYGGSIRNFNNSPVLSLKDFLTELNVFEFIGGHDNAAGFSIKKENVSKAIGLSNEKLKDVIFERNILVDFILEEDDLSIGAIKEIDDLKYFFGTGFPRVLIATTVTVDRKSFKLIGKNNNVWKIVKDCSGITYIRFKVKEDDSLLMWYVDLDSDDEIKMEIIGQCMINNYNGKLTAQIQVLEYTLLN